MNKTSKLENNPYCFHIISDFITQDNIQKLKILESNLNKDYSCEIKTYIIDDSFFRQFKSWGFNGDSSHSIYYRILIDKILPKEANKILYIDSDMLVLCDIRELFSINLGDKILASSSGYIQPVSYHQIFKSIDGGNDLVVEFKQYFCTGLMLVNMQEWRAKNVESKCMEFLQHYQTGFANQDAINYAAQDNIDLGGKWGILIYQYIMWCLQEPETTKKDYKEVFENIKIIHCNGPAKAWSNFYFLADSKLKALVFDTWWDIALNYTQGFKDDFLTLKAKLKEDETRYCVKLMLENLLETSAKLNNRMDKLEKRLHPLRYPHKALRDFFKKLF